MAFLAQVKEIRSGSRPALLGAGRSRTAFGELETGIRGGPAVVLRSKSPSMTSGALRRVVASTRSIRTLICTSAQEAGLDPDRISFTCAKNAIAARVSDAAAFSPR